MSSRNAYTFGYKEARPSGAPNAGRGQYAAIPDPLTGAALNQFVPNINPPTDQGRRVMLAFHDFELGSGGTITAALWGPDSNATFAALYQNLYLRMGFQATASMNLATSFSGNYSGTPQVMHVVPLLLMNDLIVLGIRAASGADFPGLQYFVGSFVAGALWLPLGVLLKAPQRPKPDPDHV